MGIFKRLRLPAAFLILALAALITYLLRGGFRRFEITPYLVPPGLLLGDFSRLHAFARRAVMPPEYAEICLFADVGDKIAALQ